MTVQKTLQDLNDLFSVFDNPKDKFIQLMDMAKESEGLRDSEKTDHNKIYGCTSQAWVVGDRGDNSTFIFRTESDAMIVKGLLVLLEKIFIKDPRVLALNPIPLILITYSGSDKFLIFAVPVKLLLSRKNLN